MKSKLIKSAFVAAIAIMAGINVFKAQKDVAYDRVFLTKSSSHLHHTQQS